MGRSISPTVAPAGGPLVIQYAPGLGSLDQIAGAAYLQQFLSISGFQDLTYAATVTPDVSQGSLIRVNAMTGAIVLANPTNPSIGQIMTAILIADSGGARAITYGNAFKGGPSTTTAASKGAVGSWFYDGTNWWCIGSQTNL